METKYRQIKSIESLTVYPGDLVIVTLSIDDYLQSSKEEILSIYTNTQKVFPKNKVLCITDNMKIQTMSEKELHKHGLQKIKSNSSNLAD